jgi:magnesium-transporting ATPase (P-type)
MVKFFQVLSLCHTVQIDNQAKERYQASSPDEFSFIKYCIKLGIIYEGEDKDPNSSAMIRKIIFKGQLLNYRILKIFEFDSTRKRMSVIVEDMQTNEIVLFCKGAETSIFPCCPVGDIQSCKETIDTFARNGWRTLALSYKYLTKSEYDKIENDFNDAINDILNKKAKMDKEDLKDQGVDENKEDKNGKMIKSAIASEEVTSQISTTQDVVEQAVDNGSKASVEIPNSASVSEPTIREKYAKAFDMSGFEIVK